MCYRIKISRALPSVFNLLSTSAVLLTGAIFSKKERAKSEARLDLIEAKVEGLKETIFDYRVQQNAANAKIITMLEKISKDITECQTQKQESGESKYLPTMKDLMSNYTLPINNIEELRKIDKDLNSNPEFFKVMENHFNRFIGTDGQGRGEVLGKQMAEQIMTRSLMTEMSWTGVSRTEGLQKKFVFQSLETLFKLFYNVLLKADSRWSNQKNEKLFSGTLLKHAKKRAIAEKVKLETNKTSRKHNQTTRAGAKGPSGAANTEPDGSPDDALAEVLPEHPVEVLPEPPAEVSPEPPAEVSPEPPAEVLPGPSTEPCAEISPMLQKDTNENSELLIKF